jgi:hypothetical protein
VSPTGYHDLRAVGAIVREIAPSALAAALLVGFAALWQHHSPAGLPPPRGEVEIEVIRTQMERVETIPTEVDVLAIGDSSGLMGLDAELLAELTGARVESLNMIGFVGPRAFAAVLDRYVARSGRPRRLLLMFHDQSLNRPPNWRTWEQMVVERSWAPAVPAGWFAGVRARLLAGVEPLLYVPMDGRLGDFYGPPTELGRFMRAHHGTAIDPGVRAERAATALVQVRAGYAPTREFLDGADVLSASLAKLDRDRVDLILMPEPDLYDSADTRRRRDAARDTILSRLQLDAGSQIDPAPFLPAADFATATHLNANGRRHFTTLLAKKLGRISPCEGSDPACGSGS